MIGKITGKVDTINQDSVIIDVSGVGYSVFCSAKSLSTMSVGNVASVLIETHVREDQITLFGFSSAREKQCFLKLITVKGIGPRLGLQILSQLTEDQIFASISTKDSAMFSQVSGVGPKLIRRIFTELKEEDFIGSSQPHNNAHTPADSAYTLKSDAVSALSNLGINKFDAHALVSKILAENSDIDLNNLIRISLNSVSKT